MQVYHSTEVIPIFNKAVLTIGTFDGVHLGHAKLLDQLIAEAKAINGTAVIITFFPHPQRVIGKDTSLLRLLNTQEEKYALLQKKGIEHIVIVPFDAAFAAQTATEYVHDFLIKRFKPHTIIIGYDHRFGNNREGDFNLMEKEARLSGFKVKEISEKLLQDVIISSTKIRNALGSGDVSTAANYLGYNYCVSGIVVKGRQLGRTIGYPTANIEIDDQQKLIPADGVYAVFVKITGWDDPFEGMLNIGNRPTVNGISRTIEVNIFNFNEDIYDLKLTVIFIGRLRSEIKFDGLDNLKAQLASDHLQAQTLLSSYQKKTNT